jgi:aspartate ammonia-lyase
MAKRIEKDSLGEKKIPVQVYYGIQTMRAVENFPISGLRAPEVFVKAYVLIKKAAAMANMGLGALDKKIGNAIVVSCDEVLAGKMMDQFVIDVFQAGAGTSFNMNVNEVLANRSLELLGKEKGDYKSLSPNDHVNLGQSTNDTFPSALHLSLLMAIPPLLDEVERLSEAFYGLGQKYRDVIKSGRTHLQDALPVTIGQEFSAYGFTLGSCGAQMRERSRLLEHIALGGTATGTGAGAHPEYCEQAIAELNRLTRLSLKPADNAFSALQSRNAVTAVSGSLKELALELIRISNDLRLLSSGPTTGFAEITLPAVQPGSSIMPGKVNPVMAECMDMLCFQVVGNDLTVSLAAQAGQLELNVMTPIMMHNILQSVTILTNYIPSFRKRCVEGIEVDRARCDSYIDKNPSLAVFLMPFIGYLGAAEVAKEAFKSGRSIKEVALEKGLLRKEDADRLFSHEMLLGNAGKSDTLIPMGDKKKIS